MDLDVQTKLRRYCFLGSLEPVYVRPNQRLDIGEYLPKLQELCKAVNDADFVVILRTMLHDCALVRRDETLFVYAVYLATDLDIKWKTAVRKAFPALIKGDDDLFLFCKYSGLIQKEEKHKGLSRTVRKAITAWYEHQTPEELRRMWVSNLKAHGCSHEALLKLCHVSDETIGAVGLANQFFNKPSVSKQKDDSVADAKDGSATNLDAEATTAVTAPIPQSQQNGVLQGAVTSNKSSYQKADMLSLNRLRNTNDKNEALKIIRKFKLRYNQVPQRFLSSAHIVEAVMPTMSYLQLIKCWRDLARHRHFANPKILSMFQTQLNNKTLLHKSNIHPIQFLMQMHKLRKDLPKLSVEQLNGLQVPYFKKLYAESFGENRDTGLRMHITINLQAGYKKKFLKNHSNISFYDAAIALAFGYFRKEEHVHVFYWVDDKMKLEEIPWTKDMNIEAAIAECDNIQNAKNSQRLITPIVQALPNAHIYDLFIAIVPTAGRGNPNKCSELLGKFIEKYRAMKNPKAKYVIVDLLRFRRSMLYSETRNENILEICGLDENTPNLITNFALDYFG